MAAGAGDAPAETDDAEVDDGSDDDAPSRVVKGIAALLAREVVELAKSGKFTVARFVRCCVD